MTDEMERRAVPRRTPEYFNRRAVLRGWLLGALIAAAIILASSKADIDRSAYGDGLIYRYIAAHMDAVPSELHEVVVERGPSLRYGRIGLPALIWALSGGNRSAVPYIHVLVIALAAGMASGAAAALFPRADLLAPLLPFMAPGFPLSVAGGYAEVLAVGLCLWTVVFAIRGRWWLATLGLAAAILTKENAIVVLLALAIWAMIRHQPRAAALLATSVTPALIWWAMVADRFGHYGPLDPYLRVATDTVGPPLISISRSLVHPVSAPSLLTALFHVGLAVVTLILARRSLYGLLGLTAALQLLAAAPFAWKFIGDAFRISTFLQMFALFAIVAWRRPDWAHPSSLLRSARARAEPSA